MTKNEQFRTKWVLRLSSLFVTFLLFFYVSQQVNSASSTVSNNTSFTVSETISNIPVKVNVDSERYIVTGLPETVAMRLEGTSSAIRLTVANGNYTVETPDLNELGPGIHIISLNVSGIEGNLKAIVSPETIEITIEENVSVAHDVSVSIDASALPNGVTNGIATVSPRSVQVKGAQSLVSQVQSVVAKIVVPATASSDYTTTVVLEALDESGNTLNVVMDPAQVQVKVPIVITSKQVPITLIQLGETESYSYELNSSTTYVTLMGAQSVLDTISTVNVYVPVKDITSTTTQSVTLDVPDGTSSTISSIEVVIVPTKQDTTLQTADSETNTDAQQTTDSSTTTNTSSGQ